MEPNNESTLGETKNPRQVFLTVTPSNSRSERIDTSGPSRCTTRQDILRSSSRISSYESDAHNGLVSPFPASTTDNAGNTDQRASISTLIARTSGERVCYSAPLPHSSTEIYECADLCEESGNYAMEDDHNLVYVSQPYTPQTRHDSTPLYYSGIPSLLTEAGAALYAEDASETACDIVNVRATVQTTSGSAPCTPASLPTAGMVLPIASAPLLLPAAPNAAAALGSARLASTAIVSVAATAQTTSTSIGHTSTSADPTKTTKMPASTSVLPPVLGEPTPMLRSLGSGDTIETEILVFSGNPLPFSEREMAIFRGDVQGAQSISAFSISNDLNGAATCAVAHTVTRTADIPAHSAAVDKSTTQPHILDTTNTPIDVGVNVDMPADADGSVGAGVSLSADGVNDDIDDMTVPSVVAAVAYSYNLPPASSVIPPISPAHRRGSSGGRGHPPISTLDAPLRTTDARVYSSDAPRCASDVSMPSLKSKECDRAVNAPANAGITVRAVDQHTFLCDAPTRTTNVPVKVARAPVGITEAPNVAAPMIMSDCDITAKVEVAPVAAFDPSMNEVNLGANATIVSGNPASTNADGHGSTSVTGLLNSNTSIVTPESRPNTEEGEVGRWRPVPLPTIAMTISTNIMSVPTTVTNTPHTGPSTCRSTLTSSRTPYIGSRADPSSPSSFAVPDLTSTIAPADRPHITSILTTSSPHGSASGAFPSGHTLASASFPQPLHLPPYRPTTTSSSASAASILHGAADRPYSASSLRSGGQGDMAALDVLSLPPHDRSEIGLSCLSAASVDDQYAYAHMRMSSYMHVNGAHNSHTPAQPRAQAQTHLFDGHCAPERVNVHLNSNIGMGTSARTRMGADADTGMRVDSDMGVRKAVWQRDMYTGAHEYEYGYGSAQEYRYGYLEGDMDDDLGAFSQFPPSQVPRTTRTTYRTLAHSHAIHSQPERPDTYFAKCGSPRPSQHTLPPGAPAAAHQTLPDEAVPRISASAECCLHTDMESVKGVKEGDIVAGPDGTYAHVHTTSTSPSKQHTMGASPLQSIMMATRNTRLNACMMTDGYKARGVEKEDLACDMHVHNGKEAEEGTAGGNDNASQGRCARMRKKEEGKVEGEAALKAGDGCVHSGECGSNLQISATNNVMNANGTVNVNKKNSIDAMDDDADNKTNPHTHNLNDTPTVAFAATALELPLASPTVRSRDIPLPNILSTLPQPHFGPHPRDCLGNTTPDTQSHRLPASRIVCAATDLKNCTQDCPGATSAQTIALPASLSTHALSHTHASTDTHAHTQAPVHIPPRSHVLRPVTEQLRSVWAVDALHGPAAIESGSFSLLDEPYPATAASSPTHCATHAGKYPPAFALAPPLQKQTLPTHQTHTSGCVDRLKEYASNGSVDRPSTLPTPTPRRNPIPATKPTPPHDIHHALPRATPVFAEALLPATQASMPLHTANVATSMLEASLLQLQGSNQGRGHTGTGNDGDNGQYRAAYDAACTVEDNDSNDGEVGALTPLSLPPQTLVIAHSLVSSAPEMQSYLRRTSTVTTETEHGTKGSREYCDALAHLATRTYQRAGVVTDTVASHSSATLAGPDSKRTHPVRDAPVKEATEVVHVDDTSIDNADCAVNAVAHGLAEHKNADPHHSSQPHTYQLCGDGVAISNDKNGGVLTLPPVHAGIDYNISISSMQRMRPTSLGMSVSSEKIGFSGITFPCPTTASVLLKRAYSPSADLDVVIPRSTCLSTGTSHGPSPIHALIPSVEGISMIVGGIDARCPSVESRGVPTPVNERVNAQDLPIGQRLASAVTTAGNARSQGHAVETLPKAGLNESAQQDQLAEMRLTVTAAQPHPTKPTTDHQQQQCQLPQRQTQQLAAKAGLQQYPSGVALCQNPSDDNHGRGDRGRGFGGGNGGARGADCGSCCGLSGSRHDRVIGIDGNRPISAPTASTATAAGTPHTSTVIASAAATTPSDLLARYPSVPDASNTPAVLAAHATTATGACASACVFTDSVSTPVAAECTPLCIPISISAQDQYKPFATSPRASIVSQADMGVMVPVPARERTPTKFSAKDNSERFSGIVVPRPGSYAASSGQGVALGTPLHSDQYAAAASPSQIPPCAAPSATASIVANTMGADVAKTAVEIRVSMHDDEATETTHSNDRADGNHSGGVIGHGGYSMTANDSNFAIRNHSIVEVIDGSHAAATNMLRDTDMRDADTITGMETNVDMVASTILTTSSTTFPASGPISTSLSTYNHTSTSIVSTSPLASAVKPLSIAETRLVTRTLAPIAETDKDGEDEDTVGGVERERPGSIEERLILETDNEDKSGARERKIHKSDSGRAERSQIVYADLKKDTEASIVAAHQYVYRYPSEHAHHTTSHSDNPSHRGQTHYPAAATSTATVASVTARGRARNSEDCHRRGGSPSTSPSPRRSSGLVGLFGSDLLRLSSASICDRRSGGAAGIGVGPVSTNDGNSNSISDSCSERNGQLGGSGGVVGASTLRSSSSSIVVVTHINEFTAALQSSRSLMGSIGLHDNGYSRSVLSCISSTLTGASPSATFTRVGMEPRAEGLRSRMMRGRSAEEATGGCGQGDANRDGNDATNISTGADVGDHECAKTYDTQTSITTHVITGAHKAATSSSGSVLMAIRAGVCAGAVRGSEGSVAASCAVTGEASTAASQKHLHKAAGSYATTDMQGNMDRTEDDPGRIGIGNAATGVAIDDIVGTVLPASNDPTEEHVDVTVSLYGYGYGYADGDEDEHEGGGTVRNTALETSHINGGVEDMRDGNDTNAVTATPASLVSDGQNTDGATNNNIAVVSTRIQSISTASPRIPADTRRPAHTPFISTSPQAFPITPASKQALVVAPGSEPAVSNAVAFRTPTPRRPPVFAPVREAEAEGVVREKERMEAREVRVALEQSAAEKDEKESVLASDDSCRVFRPLPLDADMSNNSNSMPLGTGMGRREGSSDGKGNANGGEVAVNGGVGNGPTMAIAITRTGAGTRAVTTPGNGVGKTASVAGAGAGGVRLGLTKMAPIPATIRLGMADADEGTVIIYCFGSNTRDLPITYKEWLHFTVRGQPRHPPHSLDVSLPRISVIVYRDTREKLRDIPFCADTLARGLSLTAPPTPKRPDTSIILPPTTPQARRPPSDYNPWLLRYVLGKMGIFPEIPLPDPVEIPASTPLGSPYCDPSLAPQVVPVYTPFAKPRPPTPVKVKLILTRSARTPEVGLGGLGRRDVSSKDRREAEAGVRNKRDTIVGEVLHHSAQHTSAAPRWPQINTTVTQRDKSSRHHTLKSIPANSPPCNNALSSSAHTNNTLPSNAMYGDTPVFATPSQRSLQRVNSGRTPGGDDPSRGATCVRDTSAAIPSPASLGLSRPVPVSVTVPMRAHTRSSVSRPSPPTINSNAATLDYNTNAYTSGDMTTNVYTHADMTAGPHPRLSSSVVTKATYTATTTTTSATGMNVRPSPVISIGAGMGTTTVLGLATNVDVGTNTPTPIGNNIAVLERLSDDSSFSEALQIPDRLTVNATNCTASYVDMLTMIDKDAHTPVSATNDNKRGSHSDHNNTISTKTNNSANMNNGSNAISGQGPQQTSMAATSAATAPTLVPYTSTLPTTTASTFPARISAAPPSTLHSTSVPAPTPALKAPPTASPASASPHSWSRVPPVSPIAASPIDITSRVPPRRNTAIGNSLLVPHSHSATNTNTDTNTLAPVITHTATNTVPSTTTTITATGVGTPIGECHVSSSQAFVSVLVETPTPISHAQYLQPRPSPAPERHTCQHSPAPTHVHTPTCSHGHAHAHVHTRTQQQTAAQQQTQVGTLTLLPPTRVGTVGASLGQIDVAAVSMADRAQSSVVSLPSTLMATGHVNHSVDAGMMTDAVAGNHTATHEEAEGNFIFVSRPESGRLGKRYPGARKQRKVARCDHTIASVSTRNSARSAFARVQLPVHHTQDGDVYCGSHTDNSSNTSSSSDVVRHSGPGSSTNSSTSTGSGSGPAISTCTGARVRKHSLACAPVNDAAELHPVVNSSGNGMSPGTNTGVSPCTGMGVGMGVMTGRRSSRKRMSFADEGSNDSNSDLCGGTHTPCTPTSGSAHVCGTYTPNTAATTAVSMGCGSGGATSPHRSMLHVLVTTPVATSAGTVAVDNTFNCTPPTIVVTASTTTAITHATANPGAGVGAGRASGTSIGTGACAVATSKHDAMTTLKDTGSTGIAVATTAYSIPAAQARNGGPSIRDNVQAGAGSGTSHDNDSVVTQPSNGALANSGDTFKWLL